ncbi:ABC transporter permease subunit [Lysinibacillus sp. NPDC048646]|uniref:ABC transporter permease subunit n=1 Tax=Lysinibacillus sp. NPDC048646 TaxID=3390574 RepID=UPI003D038DE5
MLSKTIFKQTLKANFKLWIIFTVITSVMLAVMIAVFEPTTISGVTDMIKDTALGDMLKNTTFLGMLASTFYSLHGVLLPVIFIIMTANSLIASQVDRGSMAYLLSTPIKRSTVVRTQAFYLIVALMMMFVVVTSLGLASIQIFQSDVDISISDFLMLNLGLFLLMFAISGISFFFSCLFNLTKNSLALGAGIPIAFFLFHLMAQISKSLEGIKYISLNTLFDTDAILNGDSIAIQFIMLIGIGIVLYALGIRVFQQKDLPL